MGGSEMSWKASGVFLCMGGDCRPAVSTAVKNRSKMLPYASISYIVLLARTGGTNRFPATIMIGHGLLLTASTAC